MQDKSTTSYEFKQKLQNLKLINEKSMPYQTNSSDCGVFVCKYAEYLSIDKIFDFNQKDMKYFRQKIQLRILHETFN
jgi:Ulp1 family protease